MGEKEIKIDSLLGREFDFVVEGGRLRVFVEKLSYKRNGESLYRLAKVQVKKEVRNG